MRILLYAAVMLATSATYSMAAVGGICGGIMGTQCDANEWCSYTAENVCGVADQTGICKPRPEVCTADFMPVCGCNGVTYSNACQAHVAGESVAYVGTCRVPDKQACQQVISCGTKDGKRKEYPTPCAAAEDGATDVSPKTGNICESAQ